MDPFTAFVAVIDRLIQLVSSRARTRREQFKELVDPIFVALKPVIEEYFGALTQARNELAKTSEPDMESILADLRLRRQQIFVTRTSVTALVNEVARTCHDRHIQTFCRKVQDIFYSSFRSERSETMSPTYRSIELLEMATRAGMPRGHVIGYLNLILQQLERSWLAVAQAHAAFHVRSLSRGAL